MIEYAKIMIQGYVQGDPKSPSVKHPNFTTFTVAVSKDWTDKATNQPKQFTTWYQCVSDTKYTSDKIKQEIKGGMLVFVIGEPSCTTYQGKDGTTKTQITIRITELKRAKLEEEVSKPFPLPPRYSLLETEPNGSDEDRLPF